MNNKGFTFIEALISTLLLSFIMMGVYGVLHTGNKISSRDGVLLNLQQQARNGMDRMVREIRASTSQAIVVVDANSDRITISTPALNNIQYYRSGTDLVREYPAGTLTRIASNIAYLKFTSTGIMLTIQLRADRTYYNRTLSFPLVENVRLRNE